MRFRLRTLLIALLVVPPLLALSVSSRASTDMLRTFFIACCGLECVGFFVLVAVLIRGYLAYWRSR
jgi:hypothetical protein